MSHYENKESIKTMDDLKSIFPDGEADEMNWCVFSNGGIHGGYEKLDDLAGDLDEDYEYPPRINVLVIRPRLVSMLYGYIEVNKEDIPFLRKLVNSTLQAIAKSQSGNL
ncbi:hypothetical protein WMW72_12040 [Paenibacillus filicis]|uniref:Uncharacterized protein n=1 Tax=Paenibacillus filicis TaxID=669464 RepID=A0ABU9DKB5_9BACL